MHAITHYFLIILLYFVIIYSHKIICVYFICIMEVVYNGKILIFS